MGTTTKEQRFPYSFKTVAVRDTAATDLTSFGGVNNLHMIGLEVILPKDFYACEGLYAHLRFSGTSANVTSVYVFDDSVAPTWIRSVPTSYAAVSSVVDVRIDVTALKNTSGRNIVMFNFDAAISGTIKILKVDMLYQVIGIR
jgi:hypothetical protein